MDNKKASKGFTLIEAIIALAIWMILSLSVVFIWQYTAQRTNALLERQSAFENARVSMDALLMNLQMAQTITLLVEDSTDYALRSLSLVEIDPNGNRHTYIFTFNPRLSPTATRYRQLLFGNAEFASNIAMIQVRPRGQHMRVIVMTGCDDPIILEGSVDIRYKYLRVNYVLR